MNKEASSKERQRNTDTHAHGSIESQIPASNAVFHVAVFSSIQIVPSAFRIFEPPELKLDLNALESELTCTRLHVCLQRMSKTLVCITVICILFCTTNFRERYLVVLRRDILQRIWIFGSAAYKYAALVRRHNP